MAFLMKPANFRSSAVTLSPGRVFAQAEKQFKNTLFNSYDIPEAKYADKIFLGARRLE
jgi:hypothetical protein